jgi:hypothetical protein
MLWATAVVGLRALFRIDPLWLLWGALGLAAAGAFGFIRARRQIPSASVVRAMLDGRGSLGGLLMAAEVADIGPWADKIADVYLPALHWRARRQLGLLAMGAAFLAAALLAPDRYVAAGDDALQVGGEIHKLAERIQVLKQEDILPPEKAKAIEKDLDHLRQEAVGKDPAKTMEALDHLEQSFNKSAAEAAESVIKQAEKASRVQDLAEALQSAQGQMDPKKCSEAMKELAQMAEQAVAENKALSEELSPELSKDLQEALGDRNSNLSPEQIEKLAKAMKSCKARGRATMMKLVQARLVDAQQLELCDKACEGGEKDPLAALGEDGDPLAGMGDGSEEGGDNSMSIDGGRSGRGGLNRGPSDTAMTWQDEVKKGNAAFKEKVLTPAAVSSLQQSQLVGVSVSDPKSTKPGDGSAGGALQSAKAGGGEARVQAILPEHEKAVQRYFKREKK